MIYNESEIPAAILSQLEDLVSDLQSLETDLACLDTVLAVSELSNFVPAHNEIEQ